MSAWAEGWQSAVLGSFCWCSSYTLAMESLVVTVLTCLFILPACFAQSRYDYTLKVSVNTSSSNEIGDSDTLVEDLIGQTVQLICRSNACLVGAKLEWLDGKVPIRNDSNANLRLSRSVSWYNTLTLHIENFSEENYGEYQCRCIKDLSDNLLPGKSIVQDDLSNLGMLSKNMFCSEDSSVLTLLPSNQESESELIVDEFVNSSENTAKLSCESENWIIWRANSAPYRVTGSQGYNVTVNKSTDQSKVICLSQNYTLQKIFYVSIMDYIQLPLEFISPSSDDAENVILDANDHNWPVLCAIAKPERSDPELAPALTTANFSLMILNGTTHIKTVQGIGTSPTLEPFRQNNNFLEWYYFHLFLEGLFPGFAPNFTPTLESLYSPNVTITCSAESTWEPRITATFRLKRPGEKPSPSSTLQECLPATSLPPTSNFPAPTPVPRSSLLSSTTLVDVGTTPVSTSSTIARSFHSASDFPAPTSAANIPLSTLTESNFKVMTAVPISTPITSAGGNVINDNSRDILQSLGALSFLVFVGILILLIVLICMKKGCRRRKSMTLSELMGKELLLECGIDQDGNGQSSLPNFTFSSRFHSNQLANCVYELEENHWMFPYDQLEIGEMLGFGAFGMVKKAIAHSEEGPPVVAAVKMLKEDGTEEDFKDLVSELRVLQHVGAHPNIVSFLGASIHQGNLHVIVEFCGQGSLLRYLRSKRSDRSNPLTPSLLVAMATQVAQGMQHLASKKCIHRDLAARNVLVTNDLILKVADFGLARKVYNSIYRPSGGRVPVKWMALETILDREYTTQSDVWSFGVLLWEIMSLGRSPYPGKSPEEVIKCIERGYRMPSPDNCPDSVYSLMLKCWDEVPSARPGFAELCEITTEIARKLECQESMDSTGAHFINPSPSGPSHSSIDSELCCYCAASGTYCSQCSNASLSDSSHHKYVNTIMSRDCTPEPTGTKPALHALGNHLEAATSTPTIPTAKRIFNKATGHSSSSVPYLQVLWSSMDYLPLVRATNMSSKAVGFDTSYVQSMCSMCEERVCMPRGNHMLCNSTSLHDLQDKSFESVCSRCRCELDCEVTVNKSAVSLRSLSPDHYDHLMKRVTSVIPSRLSSEPPTLRSELPPQLHQPPGPVEKARVEQQQSNMSSDSGVETTSLIDFSAISWAGKGVRETGGCHHGHRSSSTAVTQEESSCLPHKGSLSERKNLASHQNEHVHQNKNYNLASKTPANSSYSQKFSAHPRFRTLFDQMGVTETDV